MVFKYTNFLGDPYNLRDNDTLVLQSSSLTCSYNLIFVPMRELSKARTKIVVL